VFEYLAQAKPGLYTNYGLGVRYPIQVRQACDVCIGVAPDWSWACEFKLLRMLGDNGKPNDNMLMHILSPYPQHRSAVTDCVKLIHSGFSCSKAVVIFGYDSEEYPLELAVSAFEALAGAVVELGARAEERFDNLRHPVHRCGAVYGWELMGAR
jgi:hypothetical protein